MDAGKWLADTAKEAVGVNDFKKAGDAYNRLDKKIKSNDSIASKAGATAKETAVGLGDVAVGAGKALINVGALLVPEAKAQGIASGVSKGIAKALGRAPKKIETPYKGGIPGGRQFTKPSTGNGRTQVLEKPKVTQKTQEAAPKAEVDPKTSSSSKVETQPKTETKKPSSKTGRATAFAAGAAASALGATSKGDGPWNPSAIV